MQESSVESRHPRPKPQDLLRIVRLLNRSRKHLEAIDPLMTEFVALGISDEDFVVVRGMLIAFYETFRDRETSHRIDSYLMAAMGAVDLVLLTVLLPMGMPDRALSVAMYALAVSLVLTASSLFVSFVKRDQKIPVYGSVHSTVTLFALLSGALAVGGTFWHTSASLGIVFSTLAVIFGGVSLGYGSLAVVFGKLADIMRVISAPPSAPETPAD